MALTGMHIVCGGAGGLGVNGGAQAGILTQPQLLALFGPIFWSDTQANPGTTTNIAPGSVNNQAIFQFVSSADSYAAWGANPSSASNRIFCPAGIPVSVIGRGGDKVAWTTA